MVARCGNVVVNVLKCQGVEIVVVVVFVWGGGLLGGVAVLPKVQLVVNREPHQIGGGKETHEGRDFYCRIQVGQGRGEREKMRVFN